MIVLSFNWFVEMVFVNASCAGNGVGPVGDARALGAVDGGPELAADVEIDGPTGRETVCFTGTGGGTTEVSVVAGSVESVTRSTRIPGVF